MKIKRVDTEEARRYWNLMEENSKIVASWPEWKRGARPTTPIASQAEVSAPSPGDSRAPSQKK
jgi:hypothetical protein